MASRCLRREHRSAVKTRTYGRLQLTEIDIGTSIEQALELPWARAGVATLRRTRLGVELEVGPYVGTLVFHNGLVVQIDELVPGTVAACLSLSSSGRRQAEQLATPSRPVPAIVALAREFLHSLEGQLAQSIRKEYVTVEAVSSRPRGKALVRETVLNLWAKGRTDRVTTRYRSLTENTATNRYLLAASLRAEHLLSQHHAEKGRVQQCVHALSGAQLVAYPPFPSNELEIDEGLLRTLRVGRALLDGVPLGTQSGDAQFSSWVNVDRVFEEAVRQLCRIAMPSAQVSDGKSQKIMLFHAAHGEAEAVRKRADPDIVIRRHGKVGLVDAKYRSSGERVTEDALYQLIAHAGAFAADAAALVAPALHGPPRIQRLGRVNGGCSIDIIAVDPAQPGSTQSLIQSWALTLES
ncbi:hypothetical protein [Streptomyces sp. NPDC002889]|uniref:5-methylcytosine restriction system specificity protein McrC n=1 Tax=Streptomyces sp. NPDC002889 TaxID=3364669 RepID=UPI0036B3D0BF